MFLNQLEDGNKELFLQMCSYAALSNGVMEDEEEKMIFEYCRELNVAEHIPAHDMTLDAVLDELASKATAKEKNIIILEILGLIKSDGVYDEKEKKFMSHLISKLQVDEVFLNKMNHLLDSYAKVCKEIYVTICE